MNVVIGAKTDPGRRTSNEDRYAVLDARRLRADGVLVIADGMGGRRMGEQAAAAAVETVQETLVEALSAEQPTQADTGEALVSALRKANARVYEMSREGDEAGRGMGTTCVAAVVAQDALFVAHAGDSRAYRLRDGTLERLTDDHSYVAEQVRAGTLTEENARQSRFRNVITRAIGIEPTIAPDVSRHEARAGDLLLLCTDGLTNMVAEADIAQTLQHAPSPQAAADRLVQLATRAGGKDNITALVGRLAVGDGTQQMRAQDLAAPPPVSAPAPKRAPVSAPRRPPAPLPVWPTLAGLVIALLGLLCGEFAHVLARDGYRFQAAPPFAARPTAVVARPATPPDLADVLYAPPALFSIKPVQGGLLSVNAADGSLTAVTLDGRVVHLSPQGAVLSLSPPPSPQADKTRPVFAADGDQHVATDAQGNVYVADLGSRDIRKYDAGLRPLGRIGGLSGPAALAVAPDGTLYVVDAERLKVIRTISTP